MYQNYYKTQMIIRFKYDFNKKIIAKAIFFLLFILCTNHLDLFADNWIKSFTATSKNSYAHTSCYLPNGEMVFGIGTFDEHGVLVKTTKNGIIITEKKLDHVKIIKKILPTSDGNLFICGSTDSSDQTGPNLFWMKLDQNLNIIWSNQSYRAFQDICESAIQHSDGTYYVVGYGSRTGDELTNRDAVIYHIDTDGNRIKSFISQSIGADYYNNIKENTDGSLIVVGTKIYQVAMDMHIINFSKELSILKSKTLGGVADESAYDIMIDNGSYFILGGTASYGAGQFDIILTKLDQAFNILKSNIYGTKGNELGLSIKKDNNHFIIVGNTDSVDVKDSISVPNKIYMMLTDLDGNLETTYLFNKNSRISTLNSLSISSSNEIILAFNSSHFSSGFYNDWVILKTDSFKLKCCELLSPTLFTMSTANVSSRVTNFNISNAGNYTPLSKNTSTVVFKPNRSCGETNDTTQIELQNMLTFCRNETIKFTSNSSFNPKNYTWIFGDTISISTLPEPSFSFDTLGFFNIYLITEFECNSDTDTVTLEIVENKPYSVTLKKEGYCIGEPIFFGVESSSDHITKYHWDFGEQTMSNDTSNVEEPYFTFNTPGTYTVKLFSKTTCGSRTDSITLTIANRDEAEIDEIASSYCKNYSVAFGVIANTTPTVFKWNFGDIGSPNNTYNGIDAEHIYTKAGNYICTLITEFECNSDTDTIVVNIVDYRPVSTKISAIGECANKPFSFDVDNNMTSADYYWALDDGTTTITYDEKNFSHQFSKGGIYTIYATVSDDNCNKGLDTLILNVPDFAPAVVESLNDPCLQNVVLQSKNESNTVLWVLENGYTSNEKTLVYTFPSTGEYEVKLYTNPNTGCADSTLVTVPFIKENINGGIYIPEVFSPNGDGNNDVFIIQNTTNNPCKLKQFKVYDRWGKIIYSENNIDTYSWDGKLNGKNVVPGAYIGFLEFETHVKSFVIHVVY